MDRYNQTCWLGDDDVIKIKALEKMPLLDYFLLLDKKINEMKKEQNGRRSTKRSN